MNRVTKLEKRNRRHKRIRAKISGTKERPRISIFKSNTTIYAQIIDDTAEKTLVSASTKDAKGKTLLDKSKEAGKNLAEKAAKHKIKKVVFDRGGYIYTGNIKAFTEGAREGGLSF